jgi:hypothetical protein
MARENKVIRLFRLLVDQCDAKVQYDIKGSTDIVPDLVVTLTVYGQRLTFNSTSNQFKIFCVGLAREELGEAFTQANMKALNLQLETIATRNQTVMKTPQTCGCADSANEIDDE